jgi:hypothetical protein
MSKKVLVFMGLLVAGMFYLGMSNYSKGDSPTADNNNSPVATIVSVATDLPTTVDSASNPDPNLNRVLESGDNVVNQSADITKTGIGAVETFLTRLLIGIVIVILAVVSIFLFAVARGFTASHPKVRVTSLMDNGTPVQIDASHLYIGPNGSVPEGGSLLGAAERAAVRLANPGAARFLPRNDD